MSTEIHDKLHELDDEGKNECGKLINKSKP